MSHIIGTSAQRTPYFALSKSAHPTFIETSEVALAMRGHHFFFWREEGIIFSVPQVVAIKIMFPLFHSYIYLTI